MAKHLLVIGFLLLATTRNGLAQGSETNAKEPAVTLKVGDAAPDCRSTLWLQGEPVVSFAKGTVYLIVFWNTTEGNRCETVHLLNQFHKRFQEQHVVLVGVNSADIKSPEQIAALVRGKIDYRIAIDTNGEMASTWLKAAGRRIATSFVVDKQGKIAWICHPRELDVDVFGDFLADTFDPRSPQAKRHEEEVRLSKDRRLLRLDADIRTAIEAKNWDAALASSAEMSKLQPSLRGDYFTPLEIFAQRGDGNNAAKVARQISDTYGTDAGIQDYVAYTLLNAPNLVPRDLDLIELLARRACESGNNYWSELVVLARVLFLKGQAEQAIAVQQQAIDQLSDGNVKDMLREELDSLKRGERPRMWNGAQ